MPPDWKLTILLTSKQAILRPLLPCDITLGYVDGLNDPEVLAFMRKPPEPWNWDRMKDYVVQKWESDSDVLFGIYYPDRLIGTLRLHDIVEKSSATMGICIFDKQYWGQGLAPSGTNPTQESAANGCTVRLC